MDKDRGDKAINIEAPNRITVSYEFDRLAELDVPAFMKDRGKRILKTFRRNQS